MDRHATEDIGAVHTSLSLSINVTKHNVKKGKNVFISIADAVMLLRLMVPVRFFPGSLTRQITLNKF
ncbi:hypothetical protein [Yersinia similis]|uniref:hypothetical protein n=1 Tax=Yersinia similis TaxID=367190 RepID=UPI0005DE4A67|nr:hypothetical protein [Yersinia similis]CNC24303.1 Uncharacterised protein [Yersinia similis]CNF45605.1 Uncharacterised protein [Yersinia similis]